MMKKILCLLLTLVLSMGMLSACNGETPSGEANSPTPIGTSSQQAQPDPNSVQLLSFSQAQSVEEMQKLNGRKVSIIGYMSTLSPISGAFMYLMNLPYQSCPFCIPNTTQLANTIAVYAKDKKGFEFTDRAIRVEGVLEFGAYTDEFGYEYSYRIKDATYKILDTDDMDPKLKQWQQLASTDIISEVYAMYEYLNFLCFWPTYTATFSNGKDYLYPADALNFIKKDGAQFNYGYVEGYFDDMIATVESVSTTDYTALVANIREAQALAEKALAELEAGNCISVEEYSGAFKDGRSQYRMMLADELEIEMKRIYNSFSAWLAGWEL